MNARYTCATALHTCARYTTATLLHTCARYTTPGSALHACVRQSTPAIALHTCARYNTILLLLQQSTLVRATVLHNSCYITTHLACYNTTVLLMSLHCYTSCPKVRPYTVLLLQHYNTTRFRMRVSILSCNVTKNLTDHKMQEERVQRYLKFSGCWKYI